MFVGSMHVTDEVDPNKTIEALELEIARLHFYKMAIQRMCSVRLETVDDYIRLAKQTMDDYYNKDPRRI